MSDPHKLERFLSAQEPVFAQVLAELRRGRKASHWMWFIFPQIRGLGSSPMAIRYAIESKAEAEAYLQHQVLGPRLRECTQLVLDVKGSTVDDIFGYPDNLKFHSSMTLFSEVAEPDQNHEKNVFRVALKRYFEGQEDAATLERL
jgi:uncharacterized protein (DUF1810 family)